jgi:hypothetical protein
MKFLYSFLVISIVSLIWTYKSIVGVEPIFMSLKSLFITIINANLKEFNEGRSFSIWFRCLLYTSMAYFIAYVNKKNVMKRKL